MLSSLYFFSSFMLGFSDLPKAPHHLVILFYFARELFFRHALLEIGIFASALLYALPIPLLFAKDFSSYLLLFFFFLATGLALSFFAKKHGLLTAFIASTLSYIFYLGYLNSPFFSSVILALLLLSLPLYITIDKNEGLEKLGLTSRGFLKNALIGICSGVGILLITSLLLFIFSYFGVGDTEKVARKIASAPPYIVLVGVIIAPISEEVFFRGFLMPILGVFLSSLIFAIAHIQYGSVGEIVGAFAIGLLLCYLYKKTGSIIAPIFAHATINTVSFVALYLSKTVVL
ncbi:MAG: type II CAAX endopeptidase family protein [Candidatus Micrarchaeia archaeon]